MKFLINDVEIKTVLKGAKISGCLGLLSRSAAFSFPCTEEIPETMAYTAKVGYGVVIKNDDNKNIFKGKITKIEYSLDKNIVNVEARDLLEEFLYKKIKGRFKGKPLQIFDILKCKFSVINNIANFFKKEINIVNLGKMSVYDIIKVILTELFGSNFKLYIDGYGKIKLLLPLIDKSVRTLILGEDIISASFSADKDNNSSKIKATGRDDVVSGSIIKIVDVMAGVENTFVVESDVHIYNDVHIMELVVKERGLLK